MMLMRSCYEPGWEKGLGWVGTGFSVVRLGPYVFELYEHNA